MKYLIFAKASLGCLFANPWERTHIWRPLIQVDCAGTSIFSSNLEKSDLKGWWMIFDKIQNVLEILTL